MFTGRCGVTGYVISNLHSVCECRPPLSQSAIWSSMRPGQATATGLVMFHTQAISLDTCVLDVHHLLFEMLQHTCFYGTHRIVGPYRKHAMHLHGRLVVLPWVRHYISVCVSAAWHKFAQQRCAVRCLVSFGDGVHVVVECL
jgi:hypothetical protein